MDDSTIQEMNWQKTKAQTRARIDSNIKQSQINLENAQNEAE